MRRTKPLLWIPIALALMIDFFALVVAGTISNMASSSASGVWWVWLFLLILSLVFAGYWVAYWRRLPPP